jgi:hypothetical protein
MLLIYNHCPLKFPFAYTRVNRNVRHQACQIELSPPQLQRYFEQFLASKNDFLHFFFHPPALIKLDFDMEKSLQGHQYLFQ